MVNTSNFTVQQGSTVAFTQALHLGDKEDSHSHARVVHPLILIVALPIDSTPPNCPSPHPPKKSASYAGYLQTRIWTVRKEVKLSSILMEEAEAGPAHQKVWHLRHRAFLK